MTSRPWNTFPTLSLALHCPVCRPCKSLDVSPFARPSLYCHHGMLIKPRDWSSFIAKSTCCGHHAHPEETNSAHTLVQSLTSCFGLVDWVEKLHHQRRGLAVMVPALLLFHIHPTTLNLGFVMMLLFSGTPLFRRALLRLTLKEIDASVLMSLSVLGSVYLKFPGEGLMLLALYQIAHLVEEKFTHQSKASLEALLDSVPEKATVVEMDPFTSEPDLDHATSFPVEDVPVGSYVVVKPGEQLPLDGSVISGKASLTAEHISGEALPIQVDVGSNIPAGAYNIDGILILKTLTKVEDSTPRKIAQLAIHAQESKPQMHRWIDGVTMVWSKCALLVATAVAMGCLWCGIPFFSARGALYRALCIVTAAAPCALVLTPLAYVCALANASRRNILIKSAAMLDSLQDSQFIVLDKTGTLTQGKLVCTEILNDEDLNQDKAKLGNGFSSSSIVETPKKERALYHAVHLSKRSTHPISDAIVNAGRQHLAESENCPVLDFSLIPGCGVHGIISPRSSPPLYASLGSFDFIKKQLDNIQHSGSDLDKAMQTVQGHLGKSVSILTTHERNGTNLEWSAFCFHDQLQNLTHSAISTLQDGSWKDGKAQANRKKSLSILTGDNSMSAQTIGKILEIDEIHAEKTPEQKLDFIKHLQNSTGKGVLMIGDGINDAPALAQADVGISISETATGLSAGSADIIILNGKGVANLPFLFQLSDRVRHIIEQNLVITFTAMFLACLPATTGVMPLWLTVLVHEGSTILTAMNSCRLLLGNTRGNIKKI